MYIEQIFTGTHCQFVTADLQALLQDHLMVPLVKLVGQLKAPVALGQVDGEQWEC